MLLYDVKLSDGFIAKQSSAPCYYRYAGINASDINATAARYDSNFAPTKVPFDTGFEVSCAKKYVHTQLCVVPSANLFMRMLMGLRKKSLHG